MATLDKIDAWLRPLFAVITVQTRAELRASPDATALLAKAVVQ